MSLSSLIQRLREKPKEVRVQVSFLTALCVTGIIGLLWGVTLPTRLQGLSPSGEVAQTEDERDARSFFVNTQQSLGQLIGATNGGASDAQHEPIDSAPKSDAYRAGASETEPSDYYDDPFEKKEPIITPVNRREVRIGTTTTE